MGRAVYVTTRSAATTTTSVDDCLLALRVTYFAMTSPKTTISALVAAILTILYFVVDKFFGVQLPNEVVGAIGTVFGIALGALGVFARDNRVSSEDVGIKDRVIGTAGAGSTIKLAEPVEIVEPEPQTTPEPAAQAKDFEQ